MWKVALLVAAGWLSVGPASAAPKIERIIGKEPAYETKPPKYGLLVFGPEGKDRLWLVLDGATLYVDRSGKGDLSDPGNKVAADKSPGRDPEEDGHTFNVGAVTVAGRTHKGLAVSFAPLKRYAGGSLGRRPDVKALLMKDPKALAVHLRVDAEVAGMQGGGIGARVVFSAGPIDLTGVLQFADKPGDAPAVHVGGPLEITFYGELPSLRVDRGGDLVLVVGTPGAGPGTFAMIGYQDTVPEDVKPVGILSLPPAEAGQPRRKEVFEIKERC